MIEWIESVGGGFVIGSLVGLAMMNVGKGNDEVRTPFAIPLSAYAWATVVLYLIASVQTGNLGTIGIPVGHGEYEAEPVRYVSDAERWQFFSRFMEKNLPSCLAGVGLMHYVAFRNRKRRASPDKKQE